VPADTRTCPICQTPLPSGARRRYCSPACKTTAWRRDNPDRSAGPPRTKPTLTPAVKPQPAALRECPHCGEPVAIVALLTTPHVARPQPGDGTPDAIPLHPGRAL
jgi:endogenous inhibitor of DNA gyrase (YacG/DUF329 family)